MEIKLHLSSSSLIEYHPSICISREGYDRGHLTDQHVKKLEIRVFPGTIPLERKTS